VEEVQRGVVPITTLEAIAPQVQQLRRFGGAAA